MLQKRRAQEKILDVNSRLGNSFIKKMQGTTKMVYDTLPIDGRSVYEFFRETRRRGFPFTNVDGDSLKVAETLTIQRASISRVTITTESGLITAVEPIQSFVGTEAPLLLSDLTVQIANDTVMKPITIQHFMPEFNKNAVNEETSTFEFNTDLVIPPQLDFNVNVRAPEHSSSAAPGSEHHIRLVIEGIGSQFSAKGNL